MTEPKDKDFIEASLPSGFRDYLPQDMIARQKMLDSIRDTFERFGFVPLDTPAIEREEVLTGGDPAFRMHLFRAGIEGSKESLALRFDHTVPLARIVSQYRNEITKPFKRYQMGKVWRGERPQAGRYREFMQCDADIVGTKSLVADAEVIALMYETMTSLGFSDFLIRINNRKILNGLAHYAGFAPEKTASVLRSIDKMDKIGWEGVSRELAGKGEGEKGFSIQDSAIAAIEKFVGITGAHQWEILENAANVLKEVPEAMEGIAELREIGGYLQAMGIPEKAWAVDLSVARGLGYYTGPVFETILTNLPTIGSVFSGGRYDGLVERFAGQTTPAVGVSLGVDRLFAAMEMLDLLKESKGVAKVFVCDFDASCRGSVLRVCFELRRAGVPTVVFMGSDSSLKGQIGAALEQDAHYVVIIGASENEKAAAQIKDLVTRSQEEVAQKDVARILAARLAPGGEPPMA